MQRYPILAIPSLERGSILGITPFEHPDGELVVMLGRAGAFGVLDLGRDEPARRAALATVARRADGPFGVRVPEGVSLSPGDLPARAALVILPAGAAIDPLRDRAVLVQVTSEAEARAALASGAAGLVVKGSESGGRVGDETAFVLLQRIAAMAPGVPLWVQGGVGLRTAAACIAGGARGIVLDSQLALLEEASLSAGVKAALAAMDGGETAVVAGHRVLVRPDGPASRFRNADPAEIAAHLGARDLASDVVPAGQDAAFAAPLARRYPTARALVRALRDAMQGGLDHARETRPLAPGSPFAAAHGLVYPIVQGPMTRVSDRAAFAEAVASAGALPLLALSLLRGGEVRALLRETAARLEGRTWGVGILGFVPDEVRADQLEAIREVSPPVAVIAGGRPAQAAPLEALGTATYLHVPSPGLLDLFLQDGARRFVFEGRECGGHVGPRSSFVLWEQQIERLLASGVASETSVLFAGGIHDARSAAMVAALAAPLASAGARVGVLLGTAYLFTEEAVATGAIARVFQETALACDRTVLLETGPGHATRAAESAFAQAFEAERRRLEAAGASPRETWEALERLNLGRLRIAAKGLRREGDALVEVDPDTQRRDGLFMIGQVAALRRATCTMAELHRDVSEGSAGWLEAIPAISDARGERIEGASRAQPVREATRGADIAIVGMACIFPGAPDAPTFWSNVVRGVDAITEVPPGRWDAARHYDPDARGGDRTPSKWGGFVPEVPFDPVAWGIPPRSLPSIEPVQLLALEVARRALDDAGYLDRPFDRERASVIFGAEGGTDLSTAYGFRSMYPELVGELPADLAARLPELTEDSFPGVLANVIAGRIANRLDLGGVNYTVDAACAASLAAVDMAVKELRAGTSDLVLCGGADLHNSLHDYLLFASVHALSRAGRCRTFDADADGIVLGEGVACVVLKRLADAERDGDRIYAVIEGIAGSSDGRSLGLTAPRKEGQVRALERAYRMAGVSPASVGLVEAHGTGTVVGDRTELSTLTDVWARSGAAPQSCTLGSVKSQIGHTKCAAGLAGLVKAALAIHHRVLPPTLHVRRPNPSWDRAASPFVLRDAASPWTGEARRAAVSAFGFGGTNFHVVVAPPPDAVKGAEVPRAGFAEWPAELFLLRGADRTAALERVDRLRRVLASGDAPPLRDLARATTLGGTGPVQFALVATDRDDLGAKLDRAAAADAQGTKGSFFAPDAETARREPPLVALLFPGQGSQRPGMLRDLFVAFPRLGRLLETAPAVAARMLPPAAFTDEERAEQAAALTDTRVAQPALGLAGLALLELLGLAGVRPAMVAGHSFGELVALCAAGAVREADLAPLGEARARCILDAAGGDPGAMVAASASAGAVRAALGGLGEVVIANENAPDQTVVAGRAGAVERALEALDRAGIAARRIAVACAFHSPVVAGASAAFGRVLEDAEIGAPILPVWSNATAAPYPASAAGVRSLLAEHVERPVLFARQIEAMYEAGARVFVEAGPGRVLTGLVRRILAGKPHAAIACDDRGRGGIEALLTALAELAALGVPVEPSRLYEGRGVRAFDLERPPSFRPPATAWLVSGQGARPIAGSADGDRERTRAKDVPADATLGSRVEQPDGSPASAGATNGAALGPPNGARPPAALPERNGRGPSKKSAPRSPAHERLAAHPGESAPPVSARDEAVLAYLRNMRELVEAQRAVMLGYLGADPGALASAESSATFAPAFANGAAAVRTSPRVEGASEANGVEAVAPTTRAGLDDTSGPLEAAPPAPPSGAAVLDALLRLVSERTGYPTDLLGLDLDLEAELGIDSIKRIEILGALGRQLGLGNAPGESRQKVVEQLATVKTLRGIAEWIEQRDRALGARPTEPAPAPSSLEPGSAGTTSPSFSNGEGERAIEPAGTIERFVPRVVAAPGARTRSLRDRAFALFGDAALGEALAATLRARGASASLKAPALPAGCEVVHLEPRPGSPPGRALADLFAIAARAASARASALFAVAPLAGAFGSSTEPPSGGHAGLLRTVAMEHPSIRVRVVRIDPARGSLTEIAERLAREVEIVCDRAEVAIDAGPRRGVTWVPSPLSRGLTPRVELDASSVVLVTGGARGITARMAVALAKRFGCTLELVGRSIASTEPEDDELAAAIDRAAVRRLLAARARGTPLGAIEARCAAIFTNRAIRATIAAIERAGGRAVYHAVDLADPSRAAALVGDVYARHGRLDALVHGAGVLEDKLLAHKTADSFLRVVEAKAGSALALASALRDDVRLVALLSSVAGAFGNAGQVDYAAANDTLDRLAHWMRSRTRARVVSIGWGPWRGTGMVGPELEAEYARRGVGLIDPDEGVEAFLAEVLFGDPDDVHVLRVRAPTHGFPELAPADRDGARADSPTQRPAQHAAVEASAGS